MFGNDDDEDNDVLSWDDVVTVAVVGRDGRFWQGDYGSKVTAVSVRVVARTAEDLAAISQTEPIGDVGRGLTASTLLREVVAPAACLALLYWLSS